MLVIEREILSKVTTWRQVRGNNVVEGTLINIKFVRTYRTSANTTLSPEVEPRKPSRALKVCMKRLLDRQSGRPSSDEATRWVGNARVFPFTIGCGYQRFARREYGN